MVAAPEEPLAEERMQFTHPGEPAGARQSQLFTDVALCFSCGGDFRLVSRDDRHPQWGKELRTGPPLRGAPPRQAGSPTPHLLWL